MLSYVSKSLLTLALLAFGAGIVYGIATGDDAGTTLLVVTAAGAFLLALVTLTAGPDLDPLPSPDGAERQLAPAGGRPLFPSVWPLGAGLAVAFAAIGSATSAGVVVAAVLVSVVVLLGWVFQAWTEHPAFTARFGARLSDRLLAPLGMPLAIFGLVLLIALSISRVLLTVPESGSRVVAIVVAIVILASAFFIASQERMARAALSLLCAFALVAVVSAGIVGYSRGERTFEKKAGGPPVARSVSIAAHDTVAFTPDALAFPAGSLVPLIFDNETVGVGHNIGIYDHRGGNELFKGAIVTGPKQVEYRVQALAAGTYYFQCDVHPNMNGTLTVAESSGTSSSGSVAAGTGSTTTTAPAATSTTLQVTAGFATTPVTSAP